MNKKPKYHRPPHGLIIDFLQDSVYIRPKKASEAITDETKAQILGLALKDALTRVSKEQMELILNNIKPKEEGGSNG